jgi:HAE1 family hydrophobic/amphiphilic exporter-1
VESLLRTLRFPSGYHWLITGAEEQRRESFENLKFALVLAVLLVYMVMASLFESFLQPFIILLTLPMAGIGVAFTFFALGRPLNLMAYIGIIMLAGIAVNNAILLIDCINTLRGRGVPLEESVRRAGAIRLRPILMTTLTTILALVPLGIGVGEGAKLRAPMAVAVISGLVSSTFLTLFVVPVVYSLAARIDFGRRRQPGGPPGPGEKP